MLDVVTLWYALGVFALVLLLMKIFSANKKRSWVWFSVKKAKGYLKPREEAGAPSTVYATGSKEPIGYVAMKGEYAEVHLTLRDERGREKDEFLGTVQADGRVFKGHDRKKYDPKKKKTEKYVYGYTAHLDDPMHPTVEPSFKKIFKYFNFYKALAVYKCPPYPLPPTPPAPPPAPVQPKAEVPVSPVVPSETTEPEKTEPVESPIEEQVETKTAVPVEQKHFEADPVEKTPAEMDPLPEEKEPPELPVDDAEPEETEESEPKEELDEEEPVESETEQETSDSTEESSETEENTEEDGGNAPLNADAGTPEPAEMPKPFAVCEMTRFAREDEDDIPEMVKTAAFILLFKGLKKKGTYDVFRPTKHGWRDTAFLATLVYTIVYLFFYAAYCAVLEMPMIGEDYVMGATIAAFYFVGWALLRQLKIYYETVSGSISFQTRLNLLNKIVGMSPYSIIISVMAAISILLRFVDGEHNYELLPLEIVVVFGVLLNYTQKGANDFWTVDNPNEPKKSNEDDEDDEVEDVVAIPEGNIVQTYEWELGSVYQEKMHTEKDRVSGSLMVRFDNDYINRLRQLNPFYMQRVDLRISDYVKKMFEMIKDDPEMMQRVRWIAQEIKKQVQDCKLEKGDLYQYVMDFVQEPNIPFVLDRESKPIDYTVKYIRFPDETLYDKEGDADCKSFLAAMIFYALGYNVLYMHSDLKKHAMVGVEPRHNWFDDYFDGVNGFDSKKAFVTYEGHKYILCEVTGDQFHVGMPMDGLSVSDFEDLVPFTQENITGLQNSEMCHYKWTFEDAEGKEKVYDFNFSFEQKRVNEWREKNPFRDNEGHDNVLQMYTKNLREMYDEMNKSDEGGCLERLCTFINRKSSEARFNEYKKLTFALSFAQQPKNIRFMEDEKSDILLSILENQEMKEYVRFPEETLFDQEGDCDCKAFLEAVLFSRLGYNVVYLVNTVASHAAFAVEYRDEWKEFLGDLSMDRCVKTHNGVKYLFCESTGMFKMGEMKETMDIRDFKVVLEIPAEVNEESQESES